MKARFRYLAARLSVLFFLAALTVGSALASVLNSQFFSGDDTAQTLMSGAPYNMNDPAWISGGKQNRGVFAYKVFSALAMLGYQTEMGYNYGLRDEHLRALKAFQARNGLPVSNLLDSTCLALIDQQLVPREQALAASGQGFLLYDNMQPLDGHDISKNTLASIYTLPMAALPQYLQMSSYESVQCIVGQCVGTIKDAAGNDLSVFATPVDVTSDYRFIGAYFDPAISNTRLPSAAVHVQTVLHEYGHYLDGHLYQNVNRPNQPLFGVLDTTGFYDISYDLANCVNGCCPRKNADPMDWISKYAFNPGYGGCGAGMSVVQEDWAESFSMYVASGRVFRSAGQSNGAIAQKYAWLKTNVFQGLEYDTDLPRDMESGCNDIFGTAGALPGYAKCDDDYLWDFSLPFLADSIDTVPAPFSFTAQTNVDPVSVAISNAVTVTGINRPSAISISGGEYSLDGGGFVSSAGTVNNGSIVTVRQTSSDSYGTRSDTVLTIGGLSSVFSITTRLPLQPTLAGTPPTVAMTGVTYSFTPTAGNASTFSLGGTIPPGLVFNTANGALSGTPSLAGSYGPIIITAINDNLSAALPEFSITVSAPPGSFTQSGAMVNGRLLHSATLLPDGKVLAAGGYDDSSIPISSAELYDPATGTWSPVAPMQSAHAEHSATLLPNGRVLVAGGYDAGYNVIATAELYDPAADQWTAVPVMAAPRGGHTATLLPNGKVMVAGGSTANGAFLDSVQLFDPTTGSWQSAAPMAAERGYHSATLLQNGRVMVIGGYDTDGNTLASAELYDPATDSWNAAAPLQQARMSHTATGLPDGSILVTGGFDNDNGNLAGAERYDATAHSWSTAAPLSISRYYHTATLLNNGLVLVAGGQGPAGMLATAEVYNPLTGLWSATAPMTGAKGYHSATILADGLVLLTGGSSDVSYAETSTQAFSAGVVPQSPVQYTVTPVASSGFTITPSTPQVINENAAASFTVLAEPGYGIVFVSGCNGSLDGSAYTTGPVTGGCTINVTPVARTACASGSQPTIGDALKVLRAVVGLSPLDITDHIRYDVAPLSSNGIPLGDGTIDIADALTTLRRSVGIGGW